MSDYTQSFIEHLNRLHDQDRGALAILRRSLSFEPGAYPAAYPYVERFVGADRGASDPQRLALYLVAGLYASHPQSAPRSVAASLGEVMIRRDSRSIEKRFVALLGADPENLANYLRQVVTLLASANLGLNYGALLTDLGYWLNPFAAEKRDQIRQTWAREFYGVLVQHKTASAPSAKSTNN